MAENGFESEIGSQENLAAEAINLDIDEVLFNKSIYFLFIIINYYYSWMILSMQYQQWTNYPPWKVF